MIIIYEYLKPFFLNLHFLWMKWFFYLVSILRQHELDIAYLSFKSDMYSRSLIINGIERSTFFIVQLVVLQVFISYRI